MFPTINNYTILRKLGCGGMGTVYLARHDLTGDTVALKVIRPEILEFMDEADMQRFRREIAVTRALQHKNIVAMREAQYSNGVLFFTMEYCSGGSIHDLMRSRGGMLPIAEAGEIILHALDGLDYAHNVEEVPVQLADGSVVHARGIVHRDLKPQNIFLSEARPAPVPKIGDFGLAKAFQTAGLSGMTEKGMVMGSPGYMPRQQVVNFLFAKPEVDIWAMAATFYEMLTGSLPRDFPEGKDPWDVVFESEVVPIRDRNPSIPQRIAEVIDRVLVEDPEILVKTAADFKHQLEKAL
jgi:eukaryotic-like serine/threonine-protein kinase